MELGNLPRVRGSHQKELGNQMGQGSRQMGRLDEQPSQRGQGSRWEQGSQRELGSRQMGMLDEQPSQMGQGSQRELEIQRELGNHQRELGSQQMEVEEGLDEQLSLRELGSHQLGRGTRQREEEEELDEEEELQKEEELQMGQQHPKEQGQRVGQKARHRTTVRISCPSRHPHISSSRLVETLARSCPYQWETDHRIHLCRWGRGRNAFRKRRLVHRLRLELGNHL